MFSIGFGEIVIILLIALFVVAPAFALLAYSRGQRDGRSTERKRIGRGR